MKIAAQKVWRDKEGNLVPDGDPSAVILVAAAGQEVRESAIEKYQNKDDYFFESSPASIEKKNPLPDAFLPENLEKTVSQLRGPGLAKLRSKLSSQVGIQFHSTGPAAKEAQSLIIFQTKGASPENPIIVEFDQFILDPFTGAGQFDLVERDALRQVFDGASAGGTPVLTSATMNWQPGDVDKIIKVGANPGRFFNIVSRQSSTQVTLSDNITLPSSGLTLTMEGESEATIATKSGFPGVTPVDGSSSFSKPITSDKVYSVVFVPGDTGAGIFSIDARALYHVDPMPTPEDE